MATPNEFFINDTGPGTTTLTVYQDRGFVTIASLTDLGGNPLTQPLTLAPGAPLDFLEASGLTLLFVQFTGDAYAYPLPTVDVAAGVSATSPTGTGYVHVTNGVQDVAADPNVLKTDGSIGTVRQGGLAATLALSANGDLIDATGA